MNNIFTGLLVAAPLAFIILYFALMGKEEVKNEQHLQEATQQLHQQKFDDDFDDAWKGRPKPDSKAMKERQERIADLKDNVKVAKEKRDGLDAEFDTIKTEMDEVIKEQNQKMAEELSQKPASAAQAGVTK